MKDDGLKAVYSYLHKTCPKKQLIEELLKRIKWFDLGALIMKLDQEQLRQETKIIEEITDEYSCRKSSNSSVFATSSMPTTGEYRKRLVKTVKKGAARWKARERALDEIRKRTEEQEV